MAKVRVVVAEDSITVRKRLLEVLAADPEIEVVGEADNGKAAIDLCGSLRPDVVSMDMIMPTLTGLAATEYIMAHFPTPILVVSASLNRGEAFSTFDALAAGAVDVCEKPRGDEGDGLWEARYRSSLKLVSRIKVITHPRARLTGISSKASQSINGHTTPVPPATRAVHAQGAFNVIALGASTGGPSALTEVLLRIPPGFPAAILMVLHIDEPFGLPFASWLQEQTRHQVTYARDGEPLSGARGRVVMAPPGSHSVLSNGRIYLTSDPERHSCRPSIDVLFESLAREQAGRTVACLLTGMGRDGAEGLAQIRAGGGFTIAQDEASSIVYGMPREAARLNAAMRILPVSDIGKAVVDAVGRAQSTQREHA